MLVTFPVLFLIFFIGMLAAGMLENDYGDGLASTIVGLIGFIVCVIILVTQAQVHKQYEESATPIEEQL